MPAEAPGAAPKNPTPPMSPLDWIDEELAALDHRGLRRRLRSCVHARAWIEWDGRRLVHFGSNDYLGFAAHPAVVAGARAALAGYGFGAGASPLITGRTPLHEELERRLAAFEAAEAALLFPTGFAANVGTIPALVGRGDTVFSDAKNHASLIDGCRLSRAEVLVYRHADAGHLEDLLKPPGAAQRSETRRRLIVTDSVFSMDGDVAPLTDLCDLAERYDAMLLVDEAHATGVFGPGGRGACHAAGVADRVPIRMGTLSKALGALGGFVVGGRRLIDWLANRARSYVYSTAAPAAVCAAALAALDLLEEDPLLGERLLSRAARFRRRLGLRGWNVGGSASQIVPILLGDAAEAVARSESLLAAGLFVPAIRPPTVPAGESLLRVSLTSLHTEAMLDELLAALESAGRR